MSNADNGHHEVTGNERKVLTHWMIVRRALVGREIHVTDFKGFMVLRLG